MFANDQETIAHLKEQYAKYGTVRLIIWNTADGKWIDSLVLNELTRRGIVRFHRPAYVNMYLTGHYEYVPA